MFKTLTGRLTALYAGLLIVLAITVFLVFYSSLYIKLLNRIDDELFEDAQEIVDVFNAQHEHLKIQAFVNQEISPEETDSEFIRIVDSTGNIIASTEMKEWADIDRIMQKVVNSSHDNVIIKTINHAGNKNKVRVISMRLADNTLVQIGISQEEDLKLLASLKGIFVGATCLMVILGGTLGWFMARRSLAGVARITETALQIEEGNFSQRVAVGNEGREIVQLANAFNQMLDRINQLIMELKEVSNNIAHDLRSPLTRIRGICETTLRSDAENQEYREMSVTVIEEVDRLVNMINIMLEIAETDAGVAKIKHVPLNIQSLVQDVIELYQPLADEKNIAISAAFSEDIVVLGDLSRMQRVLANILDNAIKYTSRNGNIKFETATDGKSVVISIQDTGIGMDAETISKIFKRFYRADQARSTPGNGLGLSLALTIVKAHGGTIQVESSPGNGSKFSIILPCSPLC